MPGEFLTVDEAEILLRVSRKTIMRLIKEGKLVAFMVASAGQEARTGSWRIHNPSDRLVAYFDALNERMFHVPILSSRETAAVMGITPGHLRQMVLRKQIKPHATGVVNTFTLAEIRRAVWIREKRSRGSRQIMLKSIVAWARALLAKERAKSAEPLAAVDEMQQELQAILELPAEERATSLQQFMEKLDLFETLREAFFAGHDADHTQSLHEEDQLGTMQPGGETADSHHYHEPGSGPSQR